MDYRIQDIADLLDVVPGEPTDFRSLAYADGQMSAYKASLLLLADTRGNVIAADDFGCGIGPDVIATLATKLAGRLDTDKTCRFEVATDVGSRLAVAVHTSDGHQRKILACLVRSGKVWERRFEEMSPAEVVCGAFAWAAIHKRVDNTKLQRRIKHLLAEREMLANSHNEVIAAVVEERERRRRKERENAALEQLVQNFEAAERAKRALLDNISHELHTPLTAILGFTDLLEADLPQDERRRHLQTIRRNGQGLLQLVNDILDFFKIEAGQMVVEPADCSPFDLVEELALRMESRTSEKDLALEVDYAWPMPQVIRTDSARLGQILFNLVDNAIKFTGKGKVGVAVRYLRPGDAAPVVQFAVSDTGIGIAAEAIEELFGPFAQIDGSTSRRYGGTGLGLTISDRLAKMLGGKIEVVSRPGKGSTFTLSIDPGELQGVPMLEGPPATSANEEEAAQAAPPSEPLHGRVLLAEDAPDNQRLIGLVLRQAGLEVDLAENGRIACEQVAVASAEGKPYDLILMDMQMPELDGYEATRRLRQSGWGGPILALTAQTFDEDRKKCLAAGCDAHLAKPIDRNTFLAAVGHYLAAGSRRLVGEHG